MSEEQGRGPVDEPTVAPRRGGASSAGAGVFWPEGHEPGRADRICFALLVLSGIYGFGIMLARPALLGYNPLVLAALSGSRSALVTIGAQFATGLTTRPVVLAAFVLATFSLIKLDLLFWWAGRLWGDHFLASIVGDSRRRARQAARAESVARRWTALAIVVSNIPVLPVPKTIVFAVLGISGAAFRTIFLLDLLCAAVVQAMWLYLGFTIGEPVVQVVEVIARYSLWLTVAILVFTVAAGVFKARRAPASDQGSGASRA